ncbi:MAG: membrane dipeptidase [Thermoanaerobacteraceae bacterium]|nr:membrane dipeptidase [Thermoanaerobacteraceae bacterium]
MRVFDAHSDIWSDVTTRRLRGENEVFKARHLQHLKAAGIAANIMVVWIEPPYEDDPMKRMLDIFASIIDEFKESQDVLIQVKSSSDIEKAEEDSKIASILGIEGLDGFEDSLAALSILKEMNVLHTGLTWNGENSFATGTKGDHKRGLTDLGKEAVKKLEEMGIVLDVSHLNEKSFWDFIDIYTRPFIASHSNVYTLCPNVRNLKDEQIKAIGKAGGVIGVNAWPDFISQGEPTLDKMLDHIEYIADMIGIEHVGLGLDFSYFLDQSKVEGFASEKTVDGLNRFEDVQQIFERMAERGFLQQDIERVAYDNFRNFFIKRLMQ